MKYSKLFIIILSLVGLASRSSAIEETYLFEAKNGTQVQSFRGSLVVPENRVDSESRQISLTYIRFPSTSDNPGNPIVYLAGGPGGSGIETAKGRRFPLFMAMREFGDVIALDQRGTGQSNDIPIFKSPEKAPLDEALSVDAMKVGLLSASKKAADFWKSKGVDISGYNTRESALDLEDLRLLLGAEKLTLWGISYGSHLAMAALREMPGKIDRVVIAAVEGLEQTVKYPARTDAYFDRLQAAIDEDLQAAKAFPDLKDLMKRVHQKYEAEPKIVHFQSRSGEMIEMTVGKVELQLMASFMIADPDQAVNLPGLYSMLDAGDFSFVAPQIYHYIRNRGIHFRGMPEAMDIMSGVSEFRLAKIEEQSEGAILGDLLNFPMPHLVGGMGLEDLGETFRSPLISEVPTLALSGTLDGRTYPESAKEALAEFSNLTHVIVHNGGHNVYMQDPVISEVILNFMRGEEVATEVIVDVPSFLPQSQ
ncbi:alpha/beta hydrolase [Puniceicoccaceae bacterium K14]|nr:alpha/beta hydrolase [Puniceicoccaceae bacterium K14]